MNLYAYVDGNPVTFVDPFGLMKGERGRTAKPEGTDNPYKKMKPVPDDPRFVEYKDQNGKRVR